MDDELFLEQLSKHPALRKRMEKILSVAIDIEDRLNNRPRKVLQFKTPLEMLLIAAQSNSSVALQT